MIDDDNTLEDILGALYVAMAFPDYPDCGPIDHRLDEVKQMINRKLARTKRRIKKEWFTRALEKIEDARSHYSVGNVDEGEKMLREIEWLLKDGNKAYRRRARFAVDLKGNAEKI